MRAIQWLVRGSMMVAVLLALPGVAAAHCDGLDGPVVTAARKALDSGDVNPVLIWVQPSAEAEIKQAFNQTVSVRKLSPAAKDLADRYFFETLVRVHRAGEGAPYTGLKPAGRNVGPAIPAADKAITTGSTAALEKLLIDGVRDGVRDRFAALSAKRKFAPGDVAKGRSYVASYVGFIHYVEALYDTTTAKAEGHYAE